MAETANLDIDEVQAWLTDYLVALGLDPAEIDKGTDFDEYGLDSSGLIGMIGDLGEKFGFDLQPTVAYEYPTIEALSKFLVHGEGEYD